MPSKESKDSSDQGPLEGKASNQVPDLSLKSTKIRHLKIKDLKAAIGALSQPLNMRFAVEQLKEIRSLAEKENIKAIDVSRRLLQEGIVLYPDMKLWSEEFRSYYSKGYSFRKNNLTDFEIEQLQASIPQRGQQELPAIITEIAQISLAGLIPMRFGKTQLESVSKIAEAELLNKSSVMRNCIDIALFAKKQDISKAQISGFREGYQTAYWERLESLRQFERKRRE